MAASSYRIRALDRSTWPAFAALVEHNNGIYGGCWCMAFHPEGGDRKAQGEVNRERKHERVRSGTAHRMLLRRPTYERLGFARDRKIGKHRWVMTRDVAPRA